MTLIAPVVAVVAIVVLVAVAIRDFNCGLVFDICS